MSPTQIATCSTYAFFAPLIPVRSCSVRCRLRVRDHPVFDTLDARHERAIDRRRNAVALAPAHDGAIDEVDLGPRVLLEALQHRCLEVGGQTGGRLDPRVARIGE